MATNNQKGYAIQCVLKFTCIYRPFIKIWPFDLWRVTAKLRPNEA